MEFYTNSKPSLINENIVISLDKMIENIKKDNNNFVKKIYEKIIKPNWILISFIIIVSLFLFYRYRSSEERIKKEKIEKLQNENYDKQLDEEMENESKKILEFNDPKYENGINNFGISENPFLGANNVTFNPSIPVNMQNPQVNYLPDQIPLMVNGRLMDNVNHEMNRNNFTLQQQPDMFKYSGPYYGGTSSRLSDDGYAGFADANDQNLMEFDNLIDSKINVI